MPIDWTSFETVDQPKQADASPQWDDFELASPDSVPGRSVPLQQRATQVSAPKADILPSSAFPAPLSRRPPESFQPPSPDMLEPSLMSEFTTPIVNWKPYEIKKDDHVLTAIGKEVANIAVGIPEFFTSPIGAAAPIAAGAAPIATGVAFTTTMLYDLGKGIKDTIKGWAQMSPAQKAVAVVDLGANGLMALAAGAGTKVAAENRLFAPREGVVTSPEVKAWGASFGIGDVEPVTDIRKPQAVVRPTQPYVPPEPGQIGTIPPLETTSTERTTDVTARIGQQLSSQETQLPGVRQGQDLQTHPAEVRQTPGGQTADRGGPPPSPQGQAAPPSNELLSQWRSKLEASMQGRAINVSPDEFDAPSAHLRQVLGPDAPTWKVLVDSGILQQTEAGAPSRAGDIGLTLKPAALASPEELLRTDVARYQELTAQLKGKTLDEAQPIIAEIEAIKNRHGDLPPRLAEAPVAPTAPNVPENAPSVAQNAPIVSPEAPKVYPPITTDMIVEARGLLDRLNILYRERDVSQADRNIVMGVVDEARKGDLEPIRQWVERVSQAPPKPPKPIRRVTSLSRFQQETDVPDILSWISDNMRMLSRTSARKIWGRERYEQNSDLWDDAPDDMPMHHTSSIYGGRSGPDRVAQAAFEAGVLKTGPLPRDLWAAIRQASRVRRGLEKGETQEAAQLSQDEQNQIAWEQATQQSEGKLPVTTEEVGPGYVVEVGGGRLTASEPTDHGDVYLQGSRKFGERILQEGQTIHVDAIHPPAEQGEAEFAPEAETVAVPKAAEAPKAPEAPEAPKPVEAAGTRVGNYVKGDDGSWYLVDEQGNRRNLPRANKKISARLEEQAAAPPAPPETRTPVQVLDQATHVRVRVPEEATMIRVTDTNGRTSIVSVQDANHGENVFHRADVASIEAGFINSKRQFQRVEGDVTVEDVGRRTMQSIEAAFPPRRPATPIMTPEQVTAQVEQMFPGSQMIRVVNDPATRMSGQAHFDDDFTKLLGIDINAAAMRDAEHIRWVVEHEIAHAADKLGDIRPLLDGITNGEFMAILSDVQKRGYEVDAFGDEVAARSLQMLASDWKNRSWFEKLLGSILKLANDVGYKMTRLAAEKIAAKSMADASKLILERSTINSYAVTRSLQSLPLTPKDWEMKEFFDTIGLQAATIGGYLHRYTRQVAHADRLEVSDRARALDGMNQARELTELAQGMGGRANYYDAVRDATTQGERNEVLRSAFESATRYQQAGVNLRAKLAEKLAEIQSPGFRNKLLRAARTRERAELAEEVRKTYTLQVGASAGKIMQTLNNLRTVGGAHEQLQADLTRLQQMPQFDRAVQQHFDDIVNQLSQSDRGISLLLGGGDRIGQDIWDEYLRQRFANHLGIPQGNEFTLGQLASNVLAANRDLRNQFGSLALLARDIITTQEWNRAGSRIAQALQNDPVKAIPRMLERASTLGEREGRAETAFLTLNRGIEKTLRDYNDHEQAVQLHNAVEADPEYRQWVNDVMQNPAVQGLPVPQDVRARMEGKPQPFFRYSGQDTVYSPDGKPYHINLQFTPENVQATMADLINLNADISDWLDRAENGNDPSRLYWQERQRLLQGVLQSSAIWNPGAIESLLTRSSFGIPENLFQGLALPSAKLAFNAFKAFDRYFTQGKGWYGNNTDISERTIQKAYKSQGFDELSRKPYQRAFLNALGWEFRNGREVRAGDIINGVTIKPEDLALLHTQGKMINDLYDRLWKAGREAGAGGVMELPRIIDEFTGGAWGLRRPMEIGIHANTTLPHSFSSHGEALAIQIHSLVTARNNELTKLPERVAAEGMDEAAQNAARADIHQRFHDSLALTLNDPDVFQNAVLGFMRQRSENWVKLDGLSPFEQHYRAITDLVSNGDPTAPRTVEGVLDWIYQRLPPEEEWSLPRVRAEFSSEWEKLAERFYKMHSESDAGIRITSDKRQTAFTQGFRQDLGPAYFYDYGWIDAGEMRRYGSDMAEFGFERLMDSLRALRQNMTEAMAGLNAAAEQRKPEIVKRTAEAYRQGKDFRDLQHLQQKSLELDRLIAGMPKWIGANAVHAEGISLKGMSRFVSFMIGAALTGPRTAARISGISMGGSAWKMGIVFSQLGYGRLRSYPAAAASAITSAFRVGTATALGWYHGGERGFVPGVPLRILMNVPGAIRSATAAKGSEKLYSAIETVLRGTTDEQFAALGWWFDQKALGMTPNVALGSRVAAIMSASRTKGGVLSRPQNIPTGTASRALGAVKLAGSKPLGALEAFVSGTNVYLPGAFGYNITYDAVGRQAGWYIDMLAANARRTFDTYERLGQLGRFNFDNLTDPRNKLQPWEVLPSFAGRFRFVDPAKLPGWARPNSTNLQFARELFATSTDVDLQDLLLRYWKRLEATPREQRGAVEFLAPEEVDPSRASVAAEARARGIISRFVEQTHHAAPSNRPHQLQQAWPIQAILPFMGWSAQTLKLIDATLGRAAFSAEANGMTADTYAALAIAAGMTALGVGAFAFAGGDLEARLIRQLDRLLHHKEGTVKTIDEARDAKEAAEITLHNMTASVPMLNSTLNQLFGMTGYRGGNVGFQAFAFDKVNSMLTYARDVYRTHDLTHGLDRLAEANIPITETIIENTFERQGIQNNRNAVRVLQKLGPQDLVERRASLSIALPTEMTPYRQALLEAIGSGDQKLVAETYAAFIHKAAELGRPEPEKLARQMFSTLNPYRQAFGGVLTDQQRADTLSKASDAQRKMVSTMEQNYALAASTLGLTADFEKQEKAPPVQRSGVGGGGGGVSLPSGRAAGGGGIGRISTGMRRISLSGPKPPRIRLPGVPGASRGRAGGQSSRATPSRLVHGRLRVRSSKSRRVSASRKPRRRVSLYA